MEWLIEHAEDPIDEIVDESLNTKAKDEEEVKKEEIAGATVVTEQAHSLKCDE